MTEFSLLLPVYAGDKPAAFERALLSSTVEQSQRPAQVVVVQDGPVSAELQRVLKRYLDGIPVPGAVGAGGEGAKPGEATAVKPGEAGSTAAHGAKIPVKLVLLPENRGLTAALNAGLRECAHDIVARIDADDVSLPERFAKQLPLVAEGYDLVGSAMFEFSDAARPLPLTELRAVPEGARLRVPPIGGERIRDHARTHNPFNHPTMVYRRSRVLAVGGYQDIGKMEDYWLGIRVISSGARVANVAEPLVGYNTAGAYGRRGGWREAITEARLQYRMLRIGFVTLPQYLRNVVMKCGYRLLPAGIKRVLFERFISGGLPGDKSSAAKK